MISNLKNTFIILIIGSNFLGLFLNMNCVGIHFYAKNKLRVVNRIYMDIPELSGRIKDISPCKLGFHNRFEIYKIYLKSIYFGTAHQKEHYVALDLLDSSVVLLLDAKDYNEVLTEENIDIDNPNIAMSIAMFFLDINNDAPEFFSYIVINSVMIPGHLKKLLKLKYKIKELDHIKKNIDYERSDDIRDFFDSMIDAFNAIYIEQTINLDSLIVPPHVTVKENSYVAEFYTWQTILGTLKKWTVKINKKGLIIGFMYKTIAMWVGNDQPSYFFLGYNHFNYEWGEVTGLNGK